MFLFSKWFVDGKWRVFFLLCPAIVARYFHDCLLIKSGVYSKCDKKRCKILHWITHNHMLLCMPWLDGGFRTYKIIVYNTKVLKQSIPNDSSFSLTRNRDSHIFKLLCLYIYLFATGKYVCVDFLLLFHHSYVILKILLLLSVDVCILDNLVEPTPHSCWFHIQEKIICCKSLAT